MRLLFFPSVLKLEPSIRRHLGTWSNFEKMVEVPVEFVGYDLSASGVSPL